MKKVNFYPTKEEAYDAAHESLTNQKSNWVDTVSYYCDCGESLAYRTETGEDTNLFVVCEHCHYMNS